MGPALLWFALGYMSCVWDCSVSPLDPRWPSATGVFILLFAMRVPRFSVWGAALCGLVLDATHGGPLGPRVLAGVIATAFASHWGVGRTETNWSRTILITVDAVVIWLTVPILLAGLDRLSQSHGWAMSRSIAATTLSTSLMVFVIRSMIRSRQRTDD